MKTFAAVFWALCFFCVAPVFAVTQTERNLTVDATYHDGGNTWRITTVPTSTSTRVLLSSAAADAVQVSTPTRSLGIMAWRTREIVNVSTCLALAIYPTREFESYSSSTGVVLSSDTLPVRGNGEKYIVTHQDQVYGIWSPDPTCGPGAPGAVVSETYFSENRKR